MRMPAFILIAATLLIAPASEPDRANPSPKQQVDDLAKKIKELQAERIATLKTMAELTAAQYKSAIASVQDLYEARLLVIEAEFDAAERASDRVTLCQDIVDIFKEYEDAADVAAREALGMKTYVLRIKARRLEAEIHLQQAKAALANESK